MFFFILQPLHLVWWLIFNSKTQTFNITTTTTIPIACYHCGETCNEIVTAAEKNFCCQGCKQVFLLLSENNLCSYYNFDKNPGIKAKGKFLSEKFAYLEDETVIKKLVQYSSDAQTNVENAPQAAPAYQAEAERVSGEVTFAPANEPLGLLPGRLSPREAVGRLTACPRRP